MPAAYQDESGKWFKQCSKTGQLFGPVDNKEDLGQWFYKDKRKFDGFDTRCKEDMSQIQKQYRKNNLDKVKEAERKSRIKHSDKNKEYQKQYCESPAGLLTLYKKRAKKRGINLTLTIEWFEEQMKSPKFEYCAISGIKFINESHHPYCRSLDRISSTKGYTPDNVRWICLKYNSWKSDLTLNDVSLIFKYMSKSAGYDPIEYMREVEKGNPNPHLVLENNP
jgi:hypothetical protein